MGLFGKDAKKDPREQVREWQRKLRQESRSIDRQIANITREEQKAVKQVKEAAKKNDPATCRILAKEIVRTRRCVNKMHVSKAQINSVVMSMQHQAATIRMAGSLQQSTQVMQSMQQLVKVPEVAAAMRELSKEMMKAGIIEEMMEDTLDNMEPEEFEEEVQTEVDRVLDEILKGKLVEAPSVPAGSISVAPEQVAEEPATEDWSEMHQRLEALRSD